jgi:hypothetical protein
VAGKLGAPPTELMSPIVGTGSLSTVVLACSSNTLLTAHEICATVTSPLGPLLAAAHSGAGMSNESALQCRLGGSHLPSSKLNLLLWKLQVMQGLRKAVPVGIGCDRASLHGQAHLAFTAYNLSSTFVTITATLLVSTIFHSPFGISPM